MDIVQYRTSIGAHGNHYSLTPHWRGYIFAIASAAVSAQRSLPQTPLTRLRVTDGLLREQLCGAA